MISLAVYTVHASAILKMKFAGAHINSYQEVNLLYINHL